MILRILAFFGPLRIMLLVATALAAGGAFFATGGYYDPTTWAVIPRAVVPTMAVALMFVLLLDIIMSWAFASSSEGATRERYRRIVRVETVAWGLLLLCWLPFLFSIGRPEI